MNMFGYVWIGFWIGSDSFGKVWIGLDSYFYVSIHFVNTLNSLGLARFGICLEAFVWFWTGLDRFE